MKEKMSKEKLVWILSFLPYVAVLLFSLGLGIRDAIYGSTFLFGRSYGWNAFWSGLLFSLFYFIVEIPVLPACFLFQLCILLRTWVERLRWVPLKKYIPLCAAGCCVLLGGFWLLTHPYVITTASVHREREKEKVAAEQMIRDAEEHIGFNEQTIHGAGILGIPGYLNSHVLIDYDTLEVGLLIGGDGGSFRKVELHQTAKDSSDYRQIVDAYLMQAEIPLSAPGKRLITFCEEEENHRTVALLLFYEDGTVYCSGEIRETNGHGVFTGLHWSKFASGEGKRFREE